MCHTRKTAPSRFFFLNLPNLYTYITQNGSFHPWPRFQFYLLFRARRGEVVNVKSHLNFSPIRMHVHVFVELVCCHKETWNLHCHNKTNESDSIRITSFAKGRLGRWITIRLASVTLIDRLRNRSNRFWNLRMFSYRIKSCLFIRFTIGWLNLNFWCFF